MAQSDDLAILGLCIATLSFGMLIGWIAASFYYKPLCCPESKWSVTQTENGKTFELVN